ncbi:putative ribosome-binding factor A, mitochondrial isoform X2 [Conger conger]|uniref:putative ribosome-binding factor A, mitochondrial isoform X2 n=1 Tax=Conger conger TaxID=82655 RepID=UPI002A5A18FC|nr:putative ribosome-binding factor A, mitochondrial isoform X2 [Conger conger]
MFISVISTYLKQCIFRQQCRIHIGNKYIQESTKMHCHQILHRRRELTSTQNGMLVLGYLGRANIHTSCFLYRKNLFKKFANKSKKKLWYESPTFGPRQIGPLQHTQPKKRDATKRTRILNTILFKAISDFLNSYEIGEEIYNLNVEISKVSLPSDFSNCRIYWKTSGTFETDCQIQQLLDKCAPRLRHLLISHHVLGSVPALVFLRDKEYAALVEIENLLKIADFGEEENAEILNNNVKDGGESAQADASEQSVPAKRASLFGIDHEALNRQILDYKQRPPEAWRMSSAPAPSVTQQQLDVLGELRKQKVMEKKRKSRQPADDDITPRAYLQARYDQETDTEKGEHPEHDDEELHVQDGLAGDDRRS